MYIIFFFKLPWVKSGSRVRVGMSGVVVGAPKSIASRTSCASPAWLSLSKSTFPTIALKALASTSSKSGATNKLRYVYLLKPNYFKKQCNMYRSKLTWSTQQASSMHLIHGTSLLSTPLPLWTCINTLGK